MSAKPAARIGDIGSGHGCHFPPSPAIAGSPDVAVNNIPAVRQGDAFAPHPCPVCPAPPHGRALASGSATVFINGKQAGRVGDPVDCGGSVTNGSANVFIGARGKSARPPVGALQGMRVLADRECDLSAGSNKPK